MRIEMNESIFRPKRSVKNNIPMYDQESETVKFYESKEWKEMIYRIVQNAAPYDWEEKQHCNYFDLEEMIENYFDELIAIAKRYGETNRGMILRQAKNDAVEEASYLLDEDDYAPFFVDDEEYFEE